MTSLEQLSMFNTGGKLRTQWHSLINPLLTYFGESSRCNYTLSTSTSRLRWFYFPWCCQAFGNFFMLRVNRFPQLLLPGLIANNPGSSE